MVGMPTHCQQDTNATVVSAVLSCPSQGCANAPSPIVVRISFVQTGESNNFQR